VQNVCAVTKGGTVLKKPIFEQHSLHLESGFQMSVEKSNQMKVTTLKSQCHPKCFVRLCFCFEIWLARLLDISQIIPCRTGLSAS